MADHGIENPFGVIGRARKKKKSGPPKASVTTKKRAPVASSLQAGRKRARVKKAKRRAKSRKSPGR